MNPVNLAFSKYHGAGNDFILIDNRVQKWQPVSVEVASLCNRRFGIGADGLMLLSEEPGYDFRMTYFNSDGMESTLCGNGGRCMAAFAMKLGLAGTKTRFLAVDGEHEAWQAGDDQPGMYELRMQDCRPGAVYPDGIFINTGSPHFVVISDDAAAENVTGRGRHLRMDRRFSPGGTNVDFTEIRDDGLFVRTYERGVEDETLSCGTGVTAAVLATAGPGDILRACRTVQTPGGRFKVFYSRTGDLFTDIVLHGPVEYVFSGTIALPLPNPRT